MENFVEERASPKEVPSLDIMQFDVKGQTSKHDKQGILDENTKLRQLIARGILSQDAVLADKDMLNMALKAMADNDKIIIAQARLAVDEESNNASRDLAAAIASEIINKTPTVSPDISIHVERDLNFDLPQASREINDDELEIGTKHLSEEEILERL